MIRINPHKITFKLVIIEKVLDKVKKKYILITEHAIPKIMQQANQLYIASTLKILFNNFRIKPLQLLIIECFQDILIQLL